jgi:hypothetical protein
MFEERGARTPAVPSVGRLVVVLLLFLLSSAGGAEQRPESTVFRFERLDRTYTSFVEELAPIELDSLTIVLRSADHSMTIERHSAELTPLGSSEYETVVGFSFQGRGVLDADVTIGLVESQLQDEIVLPSQSLRLAGRVRIESSEEGYTITLLESRHETARVRIESRLAGRIIPLCRQLALVLVNLGCDVLQEALSVIEVPIPEAGTIFFLPRVELTDQEAGDFDAYLASGAANSAAP